MALADLVRRAVATVDRQTKSLQEEVDHTTWVGQDGMGAPLEPPVVITRRAIVEHATRLHKLNDGRMVEVRAKLTFLETVEPNGAADRAEPVDPRDTFTLRDGYIGRVVDVRGMRDPGAGAPVLLEVYLGG